MVRQGRRRSSSRGARGRRRRVKPRDRISELPDHLINHILSFLQSDVAVKTMVLSKRWLNLWASVTCINIEPPIFYCNERFVRNFLKNRDQHCSVSKFSIDCQGLRSMSNVCLDYVQSQNIEYLNIWRGDFDDITCLHSACWKNLHLTSCKRLPPVDCWSLPSLNSLSLHGVKFGNRISGFKNLKELTLARDFKRSSDDEIITIDCPNLQSLTLNPDCSHTFIVSAPSLSCLKYRSRYVPGFSAGDGFPCIKQVRIDIQKEYYNLTDEIRIKLSVQNLISMLNTVRRTPFLELSSNTIEVFFLKFCLISSLLKI